MLNIHQYIINCIHNTDNKDVLKTKHKIGSWRDTKKFSDMHAIRVENCTLILFKTRILHNCQVLGSILMVGGHVFFKKNTHAQSALRSYFMHSRLVTICNVTLLHDDLGKIRIIKKMLLLLVRAKEHSAKAHTGFTNSRHSMSHWEVVCTIRFIESRSMLLSHEFSCSTRWMMMIQNQNRVPREAFYRVES